MKGDILLVSDLDDTLLGDNEALRRFRDFEPPSGTSLKIAYASGRFYDSIKRDIEESPLPEPVSIIGGVGSEIRGYPDGELNDAWVSRISEQWSADKVRQVLSPHEDLELQPEADQSDFKVSYFFHDASQPQLDRLRRELHEAGVEINLIYSSQRDLDILPKGVHKGTAAAFIAEHLKFDSDHVIVAGNSGNDATLFEQGFHGIIVANAHDALKRYADDPRVHLSPRPQADGVLEGLQYWMQS